MIYLDNSATTKPFFSVAEVMLSALREDFGNPSSLHRLGFSAERILKDARKKVADLIDASPGEIVFTSGGTESNHLAIRSTLEISADRHIIASSVEHPSVLSVLQQYKEKGWEVTLLPVNSQGVIDLNRLEQSLTKDTALVSIMAVNNELGTIQPIKEIGRMLNSFPKAIFHVDAVQAAGKIKVQSPRIDLLSISAHKIHGPKGIGALYVKKGRRFVSIMPGGGQERGLRGGTENVPAIAGFGEAARISLEKMPSIGSLKIKKDELGRFIKDLIPDCVINSPEDSIHILNVSFSNIKAEVLLHSLEKEGIYVSTGSACSSKKTAHPVLTAIGLEEGLQEGTIRFSFGWGNEDIDPKYVAQTVAKKVQEIRLLLE